MKNLLCSESERLWHNSKVGKIINKSPSFGGLFTVIITLLPIDSDFSVFGRFSVRMVYGLCGGWLDFGGDKLVAVAGVSGCLFVICGIGIRRSARIYGSVALRIRRRGRLRRRFLHRERAGAVSHKFGQYHVRTYFDYAVPRDKHVVGRRYAFKKTLFTRHDESHNSAAVVEDNVADVTEFASVRHVYYCLSGHLGECILFLTHTRVYSVFLQFMRGICNNFREISVLCKKYFCSEDFINKFVVITLHKIQYIV